MLVRIRISGSLGDGITLGTMLFTVEGGSPAKFDSEYKQVKKKILPSFRKETKRPPYVSIGTLDKQKMLILRVMQELRRAGWYITRYNPDPAPVLTIKHRVFK